jgi:hypothetical protein
MLTLKKGPWNGACDAPVWQISLNAIFATPVGCLIDEEGILLRDVAVGVEPIIALTDGEAGDSGAVNLSRSEQEMVGVN